MDLLASPGGYQLDESAGLRAAVCAAAGLPEDRAQEAMQQLTEKTPGVLQELVQQHGNFTAQVLNAELTAVSEALGVLFGKVKGVEEGLGRVESTLEQILANLERAAVRGEERTPLAGYLRDWWTKAVGSRRAQSMPLDAFFKKLIQWFKDHE